MDECFYKGKPKGFVFFCVPYESNNDVQLALAYCKEVGLTADEAAIRIIYSNEPPHKKEFVVVRKK